MTMILRGAALTALLLPVAAHADRRYFLQTYSPFLSPAGEFEVETWLTAKVGRQDPNEGTAWVPRVEFEYAIHDRFSGAAYLNFEAPPGKDVRFESPSIEIIYRLADEGRIAGDPAFYLETTENGKELEVESKLLLAHRLHRWIWASNLVGEFEFRHDDEEVLPSGKVLKNAFAGELTGGVGYELSPRIALGLESRYRSEHPNFGSQSAAVLSLGPSLNLRHGEAQLAVGVLPQIWGSPKSSGNRNLVDFEKLQVRAILGIEL
jgi:hypothetical protein